MWNEFSVVRKWKLSVFNFTAYNRQSIKSLALILLVSNSLLACSYVDKMRPNAGQADNRKIERAVKSELMRRENIDATAISVKVSKGVIVLKGIVESTEGKAGAQRTVTEMYPDSQVRNDIKVR